MTATANSAPRRLHFLGSTLSAKNALLVASIEALWAAKRPCCTGLVERESLASAPTPGDAFPSALVLTDDESLIARLSTSLEGLKVLRFAQAKSHLGLEYDWVFIDLYSGINPNLLMLAMGWVKGRGGMVLCGPPGYHRGQPMPPIRQRLAPVVLPPVVPKR